jgi:hypothetical protein
MNTLTFSLILVCCWAILCRLRHTAPHRTQARVVVQHFALGLGLAGAALLPITEGKLALVAGVTVFLLLGAPRWRHGAPEGTSRTDGGTS